MLLFLRKKSRSVPCRGPRRCGRSRSRCGQIAVEPLCVDGDDSPWGEKLDTISEGALEPVGVLALRDLRLARECIGLAADGRLFLRGCLGSGDLGVVRVDDLLDPRWDGLPLPAEGLCLYQGVGVLVGLRRCLCRDDGTVHDGEALLALGPHGGGLLRVGGHL